MQLAHSALEAGRRFGNPGGETTHLILLEAKSESHLLQIAAELKEAGIEHELFFEPDDDRGWTSLTTKPLLAHERKPMFKYKLYRAKNPAADFLERLEREQLDLPPQFNKVLEDHFWRLL